jgi:hypothetical protein
MLQLSNFWNKKKSNFTKICTLSVICAEPFYTVIAENKKMPGPKGLGIFAKTYLFF